MFQTDTGPLHFQLKPEEIVGFELGDEFLDYSAKRWIPTGFALSDKHQVGMVGIYRRPKKLTLLMKVKIFFKKLKNKLKKDKI